MNRHCVTHGTRECAHPANQDRSSENPSTRDPMVFAPMGKHSHASSPRGIADKAQAVVGFVHAPNR